MNESNPLKNAKVVGANIQVESYLGQVQGVRRGDSQFVMSRSELMLSASCFSRWLAGYSFKDTDATSFGSLIDCLLTSPDQFDKRYVEPPKTVTATKTMGCVKDGQAEAGDLIPWQECKEASDWKKEQKKSGREVVSADDMTDARAAVKRFYEDKEIADLLNCSAKQVMVVAEYHDEATGLVVPTKCLIDLVPAKDSRFAKGLADLKTCRSADHRSFQKTVDQLNYDAQAAMILDHYVGATGEDRCEFLFALMENVFPFEPGKRYLSSEFVDLGRTKYVHALKRYCECLKTGIWPSFDIGWSIVNPDAYHSTLRH